MKQQLRNPVWVIIGVVQPVFYLILFAPLLEGISRAPGFPQGGAYNVFVPGQLIMLGLFGASAGPEITLPATGVYRKGLSILSYGGVAEAPERINQALIEVLGELAGGRLRVPIGEILPLESAPEAHRRILDRGVTGKVLLRP